MIKPCSDFFGCPLTITLSDLWGESYASCPLTFRFWALFLPGSIGLMNLKLWLLMGHFGP